MGTEIDYYDNALSTWPITRKYQAQQLTMSLDGCPHRGTFACLSCKFTPYVECDWNCAKCEHRGYCKCGHDQSERLQAWGLVE